MELSRTVAELLIHPSKTVLVKMRVLVWKIFNWKEKEKKKGTFQFLKVPDNHSHRNTGCQK